jgi:hypothetical protein
VTTKRRIEALREQHLDLLERSQQKGVDKEALQEIENFLAEVRNSGKDVFDPQQRDLLRSFLFYWGNLVYEEGRESYPDMTLAPFTGEVPRKGLLSDWRAWAVVAAIGALILSFGGAQALPLIERVLFRAPTAAVQIPVVGEPKVGVPTPLKPGQELGISVDVSVAPGATLTYTWNTDGGEIVKGQGSPAITYRAPDMPGTYNVSVVVNWDGQNVEKAASIKVEVPTPTPTPPPLTPTPTTSSPGITPTLPVRILQPRNGDAVPYETQIRGYYTGSIEDRDLWVIVYPHDSSRYYPQRPAEIRGDNTWFVMAHLGTPEQIGTVFDISVYVASSQADQKLREYINEADKTGNWLGIPSVADGLMLLDRVAVTRR